MATARARGADDSITRTALLDAAEAVMLEEGYAAVTSRRVATRAGLNPALVYYYFRKMDNLYLEVFWRRAESMLERQAAALEAEQPLWALWDVIRDEHKTALNLEFLALGNHRAAVRDEVAKYSGKFRRQQLDGVARILQERGVGPEIWSAEKVVMLLDGLTRFVLTEVAYDLRLAHDEAYAIIEHMIEEIEGPRLKPSRQRGRTRARATPRRSTSRAS